MNGRSRKSTLTVAAVALLAVTANQAYATITLGQADTFQDGTTMDWQEGLTSPNPPVNIANGGPAGAGDRYLQNTAAGGFGSGSRQVMYNNAQWTGDYLTAGVDRIDAMLANFGNSELVIRLAVEAGIGQQFGSTDGITLPPDSNWYAVSFDLGASGMSLISGGATLDTVLANVTELRILAASAGPAWTGDAIASTLGVDDITAAPEPTALALLAIGACVFVRRERRSIQD